MTSGQIFGILFILVSQQIFGLGDSSNTIDQDKSASLYTTIFVGAFGLTGVIPYAFFKNELKRSKL
jgi:hypothetical protein